MKHSNPSKSNLTIQDMNHKKNQIYSEQVYEASTEMKTTIYLRRDKALGWTNKIMKRNDTWDRCLPV